MNAHLQPTALQQRLLDLIDASPVPPTIRELATMLDKSRSAVEQMVARLRKRGHLAPRRPYRSRTLALAKRPIRVGKLDHLLGSVEPRASILVDCKIEISPDQLARILALEVIS